ncbi:hypothetical protein PVBG_06027 [Plasmodium vivax Brazil I]|uniref:Uncharacterized protein n=1 Tax=Plasmodium vivax (strain Brazil I) TaxID=1033975 RepID=A0A0J9SKK5_PLAV1|nr:hypothetical protein PVBG_06027 [Plasmodium vivax Brazil I]
MNYFIHTYILNSKSCNHIEQLYKQLNELIRDYHAVHNKCTIQKFTIGRDDFIKKKKLYLLGEILFWIKNKYENSEYLNIYTYDEFFGECANIYKQIITEDKCKTNANYDKELINLKDNFNITKAYLKGKKKSISHDDLQSPHESMCRNEVQAVQEGQGDKEQNLAYPGERGEEVSKKGKEPGGGAITGDKASAGEINMQAPVTLSHKQSGPEDMITDSTNPSTTNPLGTIIGTSLGFVLPLITLYKVRKSYLINIISFC